MIRFELKVNKAEDIKVLNVSKRAENALKRAGIMTIGDLCNAWNDLLKIKKCGVGTVKEIKCALFNYNIQNMSVDELSNYRIEVI